MDGYRQPEPLRLAFLPHRRFSKTTIPAPARITHQLSRAIALADL
jgi:hypothetical protein